MLEYSSSVEVPINRRPYARLKSELIGRNASPIISQAPVAQFLAHTPGTPVLARRKPVPPNSSESSDQGTTKKKEKESNVDKIDKAAQEFFSSDVNFIQMLAEASVFSAILFLQWASGITKPKRILLLAKAILVLIFLVLHPIYCVVSMLVLSVVYAHWRLHQKVK